LYKTKLCSSVIITLFVLVMVVAVQPVDASPKFILSSWDFPNDDYGQGIYRIGLRENSSGAFWDAGGPMKEPSDPGTFAWVAGVAIGFDVRIYVNYTFLGLEEPSGEAEYNFLKALHPATNYVQISASITLLGETVFSVSNFTYDELGGKIGDGVWYYSYVYDMDFVPGNGDTFIVTITYDEFFLGGSDEFETSDQSITSFNETLPDDTLFYPDSFLNGTSNLMDDGIDGGVSSDYFWNYTWVIDGNYWLCTYSKSVTGYFNDVGGGNEGFTYSIYAKYYFAYAYIEFYNFVTSVYDTIVTVTSLSLSWYNGTLNGNYVNSTGWTQMRFTMPGESGLGYMDYCHLNFYYMTLTSGNFAESFADVSDWSAGNWGSSTPEGTFTSDGDIASFQDNYAGSGTDNDGWASNTPSFATKNYYYEIRYKTNTTAANWVRIYFFTSDNQVGTYSYDDLAESTSWTTKKNYIGGLTGNGLTTIESVLLIVQSTATAKFNVQVDYLRISNSTSMGWQHDGSTTAGISSSDGGTIATDGDLITIISDADGSSFIIPTDTTATATAISCTYYPFFAISINSGFGSWTLEEYDGSAYATLQSSTEISAGTKRFNMRALDTYVSWWRITLTESDSFIFDFAKAYSIANYTYTGTGTSTDDVLYVEDDFLYCSATAITSIVLDHDPVLSLELPINSMWNINTTLGTPQTDYYVEGAWLGYSSDVAGTFDNGTLTDVRIKFTDSANIAEINFRLPIDGWGSINIVLFIFTIPWDTTTLNAFTIFLGLFMIPASTLYLVKGGKDNMSMNKVFFFIVAFILGWALVIGGIYG